MESKHMVAWHDVSAFARQTQTCCLLGRILLWYEQDWCMGCDNICLSDVAWLSTSSSNLTGGILQGFEIFLLARHPGKSRGCSQSRQNWRNIAVNRWWMSHLHFWHMIQLSRHHSNFVCFVLHLWSKWCPHKHIRLFWKSRKGIKWAAFPTKPFSLLIKWHKSHDELCNVFASYRSLMGDLNHL